VRLTPEEIEARRFRLAPNGYECEAVDRFLAEITEALREQPAPTAGSDEFSRVGQEIAAIMQTERDQAQRCGSDG
jgi:DivIVA domain-containing protein